MNIRNTIFPLIQKAARCCGYSIKRRHPSIRRGGSHGTVNVSINNLMQAVHGENIYEAFDYHAYPNDPAGWGGDSPAFAELIRETKPRFIIEVGTWKGASAITMANAMKSEGLDGRILCIDTWLGAVEFWSDQSDPRRFLSLECKHGFPSVYYRFLANVCHAGQQQCIVPFPLPSSAAALWLMRTDLRADLIYVDASHEEEDVYQDLIDYGTLLTPEGKMCGDDWCWSGVRTAVERYAKENNLAIRHLHNTWILERSR